MAIDLVVERATRAPGLPDDATIARWVEAALAGTRPEAALGLRIVDEGEGAALNARYRGREGPTNVLSFPSELPPGLGIDLLGDLVLCAPVVAAEAMAQGKAPGDHWAHLVVHGVLHLLGYDHQHEEEAERMETREREVLARLGVGDPYEPAPGSPC